MRWALSHSHTCKLTCNTHMRWGAMVCGKGDEILSNCQTAKYSCTSVPTLPYTSGKLGHTPSSHTTASTSLWRGYWHTVYTGMTRTTTLMLIPMNREKVSPSCTWYGCVPLEQTLWVLLEEHAEFIEELFRWSSGKSSTPALPGSAQCSTPPPPPPPPPPPSSSGLMLFFSLSTSLYNDLPSNQADWDSSLTFF